jgi:NAD(P)-dependent dehydrogenase (short-subunit alcohol dehydrogenase family)
LTTPAPPTKLLSRAGNAGQVNYSSAKAAVTGMTRTPAKEWKRYAATVNWVASRRIHSVPLPSYVQDEVAIRPTAGRLGDF